MNQLVDRRHTALYFFSGPDFAYAQALFPEASTYVLAGLEPADTFPAADPAKLGELTLSRVRTSFETFFDFGAFVTVNMRGSRFAGVPELLAVQLALTGNAIDDVAFVAVEAGGHETSYSPAAGTAHGIRITFHDSDGVSKRLYYFSVDLSDATIAPSGFLEFCRGLGPADVLLKNASFLLHENSFSTVRKFLLEDAASIVQDNSGIPIRYFDGAAWSLRLFGAYRPPPESFSRYGQPELIDFEKRHPPEALDFPAGYYWWIRGSSRDRGQQVPLGSASSMSDQRCLRQERFHRPTHADRGGHFGRAPYACSLRSLRVGRADKVYRSTPLSRKRSAICFLLLPKALQVLRHFP